MKSNELEALQIISDANERLREYYRLIEEDPILHKNYMQFLQTWDDVKEPDGNYHEPKFNFEGDGIGVFGSVVADTTYLTVTK